MVDAYRDRGQRPLAGPDERRWYTKPGDTEKGPYDEETIVRSVQTNKLGRGALVRQEGEPEWRPIRDVRELMDRVWPVQVISGFDERRALAMAPTGSFWRGFASSLFGGVFGYLLVLAPSSGSETRRGAGRGFLTSLVLFLAIRAAILLLHRRLPSEL
jgi:hypothetical protein